MAATLIFAVWRFVFMIVPLLDMGWFWVWGTVYGMLSVGDVMQLLALSVLFTHNRLMTYRRLTSVLFQL